MASIRKRGDKYHVQVRKQGYPTATKTFSTKSSAQAWAKKIESEIERGAYLDSSAAKNTPLSTVLDRYTVEILPSKKGGSCEGDRIRLLKRKLGHHFLINLKPHVIASYRDERIRAVQSSTIRRELGLLRSILNIAIKDWGITLPIGNPVTQIRMPQESGTRERRLQKGELERLIASLSTSPLMQHITRFAIETAMRRGEIASMMWNDINLQTRTLYIPETKTDTPRYIPLSSRALHILTNIPHRLDGLVWGVQPHSITRAFERACKRANLTDLRFHDLRHEATSQLFERGLSIMEVASITGHRDLRMLRRYTHLRAEDLLKKLG